MISRLISDAKMGGREMQKQAFRIALIPKYDASLFHEKALKLDAKGIQKCLQNQALGVQRSDF